MHCAADAVHTRTVTPCDRQLARVTDRSTSWEDRNLSPANPVRFNLRRVTGGTRLLLTESEPWKLLRQSRVRAYKEVLVDTVGEWEGVEPGPHRFGGTEFLLDGREVGHIHNFGLLDVPFTAPIGDAVVGAGEAARHHVLRKGGWVSTFVDDPDDRAHARALLRLSYCWHVAKFHTDTLERTRDDVVREVSALPLADAVTETFERTLDARTS